MKKIISSIMVMVVLFNFIFSNKVYADSGFSGMDSITENVFSAEGFQDFLQDGVANGIKLNFGLVRHMIAPIAGTIGRAIGIFPMLVQLLMCLVTESVFTIEKAVFGEIPLFNIDYFNFESTYTIGNDTSKTIENEEVVISIRGSVSKFFYISRLIAITINLLVLIYVGIRMALSTVTSDKVRYKKMLVSWIEAMVLMFLMQYIISFIIECGKVFQNIMYDFRGDMTGETLEVILINKMLLNTLVMPGWNYIYYLIGYFILIGIQLKYFLTYLKRQITVGFLIVISPFVTVTYPIDKMGDGKAQSFTVMMNELILNVMIQPIQALIYLVFMYSAGEIAKYSLWFALLFLFALTKVEKMILQLFNLKNITSLRPVGDQKTKFSFGKKK